MANQKQDNTQWCYKPSQPSFQLEETLDRRSLPRTKMTSKRLRRKSNKRDHRAFNGNGKSISTIHASVRPPNTNRHATHKQFSTDNESFFSFSSILSTRQCRLEQASLTPHERQYQRPIQRTNTNPLAHVYPRHHPVVLSQRNRWNDGDSNSILRQNNAFKTTQQDSFVTETNPTNEYGTILDKKKPRKCFSRNSFCACSIPCILLSLLIGLLLAGTIIGTVVGVLSTSNKSTTTTTLSTTTVTSTICSCLCAGESWRFDSGYLARWTFDGTLNDLTNTYNATSYNNPSFVTNGYVNQALYFNPSLIQSLSAPYISLADTSFTVEVWLKPTFTSNFTDHSILGLCPSAAPHQCLHIVIRQIASNYYLYFGFFADDCQGNTSLSANQWIHAAFVFDKTTLIQSVYLNGVLDNSCTASSPIMASAGLITIGTVPATIPIIGMNFYEGSMDHLTITQRAKSPCEILEDATLVGCFLFDAAAPYTDFGPNSLLNTELSTSIVSPGHSREAISFNGSSYFQASSFTALGLVNKPFSIVLWVRPRSVLGIIVHVSSISNGTGWCIPFLGIASNGSVVAQIYNSLGPNIWGPSIPMSPTWSHIVQTWSATNGLRLYINSVLVAYQTSAVPYTASGASNFITLANSLIGTGTCTGGGLGASARGPLIGDMDDFRVYSRELAASDVSTIYQTG